jgi:dihydroxyacid dehydratase/phosphogluconate dehydratase
MRAGFKPLVSLLAVFTALGVAGCSSRVKLAPVKGTVKQNGKPLDLILVEFIPDSATGLRSTATTDGNGAFTLHCDDQRPGAVIGVHRVVLHDVGIYGGQVWNRKKTMEAEAKGINPFKPSRLPSQYTVVSQTPLKKEVKPEAQTIDLEVTGTGAGK